MAEQHPQPPSPTPSSDVSWLQRLLRRVRGQPARGDTIAAHVDGSQNVTVGKNIIQIGTLAIPALPLALLILLAAAGLGLAAWRLLAGPAVMPDGTFNVAIATIADTDSRGQAAESQRGQAISALIGRALVRDNEQSSYGSANVTIWYDQLPRAQKAVRLGIVAGVDRDDRRRAAAVLAHDIHADIVIYGTITSDNRLVPEFYVKPQPRLEYDANAGSYQVGTTPIVIDADDKSGLEQAVTSRASALFWLIKGLQFSSAGASEQAAAVWSDAIGQLGDWEGRTTLYFLQGQAALFSAQRARRAQQPAEFDRYIAAAAAAFDAAIRLDRTNAQAYIGRGSVYKTLADGMIDAPDQLVRSPLIPSAIDSYQRAKDLAPSAADPPRVLGSATAALGTAYRLQGDMYMRLADTARARGDGAGATKLLGAADQNLGTALANLDAALAPLGATQDPRLLGQAYLALGNAASQKAIVRGLLGDRAGQRDLDVRASGFYQSCIDQGQQLSAPDTILTNDIIEQNCKPHKQDADQKAGAG